MPDTISLTGVVATVPRHVTTSEGLTITSFRLASSQRRYDRHQNSWVDVGTNWYTITAFRQLASNAASSLSKGDRVVAAGRLRIREWENGEKSGTTVEVEAESVGHDLAWGSTQFHRSMAPEQRGAASVPAAGGEEWSAVGTATVPPGSGGHPESEGFFPASDGESELLNNSAVLESSSR